MTDIIEIILLIFIAWFLVAQKSEHMAGLFGKSRKIILDSCALIDGRIIELTNSRFIVDELVIPQFILTELQLLADGNDSHKRERARFGLDIAHQLQDASPTKVTIDRSVLSEANATDDKLVLLARKLKADLYTTDYNLGKVAAVEGVQVLNINELAQALRPIALPGETLNIKIIQKGSSRDQGVGYLEDGTMIVVDGAARYTGKLVPVTVSRMHQTVAGKMVFGQVQAVAAHQSSVSPQPTATAQAHNEGQSPNNSKVQAVGRTISAARSSQKQQSTAPQSPQAALQKRLHKQSPANRRRPLV